MFGYVLPVLRREEDAARFRSMYCGLCHTLAHRYGPAARWILNYDFTFLAILLTDGEDAALRRCPLHPLRGRWTLNPTAAMELAADESVILAYWQLRDGAEDHRFPRRIPYAGAAEILRGAYARAAAAEGAFDSAVRRQLDALHALEREGCASLDRPADAFASLLRYAAERVSDPVRRRVSEQMLYHMGRWVYLIDAADDLARDSRTGNYNPVALHYGLTDGKWTEEARQEFALTLDHSIHAIAAAYELWDFGPWRPVLEDTIYTGLFQVGAAVLNGTFRRVRAGDWHRKEERREKDE